MKLSIIIPTISRPSLARTLGSIRPQIFCDDEVLLVGDGPQPAAAATFAASGVPGRYVEGPATKWWGNAQRMHGMRLARGDLLAFMDDDDIYLAGAFAAMRGADPRAVNVFRMQHPRRLLWQRRQLAHGNVSSQMLVVPNDPAILGQWGNRRAGDYDFALATAIKLCRVEFHETIICQCRP